MVDAHVVVIEPPARGFASVKNGIAVGGVQPGAAPVEGKAEGLALGPGASADPVHRLEDGDRLAGLRQRLGRGEPGGAGPDDDDVDLAHDPPPNIPKLVDSDDKYPTAGCTLCCANEAQIPLCITFVVI